MGRSRSWISRRVWVRAWLRREGGKRPLGGDVAADDVHGAGEGEPVRVAVCGAGGVVYQLTEGVMDQEEAVDLLFGGVGMSGAQDGAGAAEVGLDLIDCRFDFPPLCIESGQFGCRGGCGVGESGHQAVGGGRRAGGQGVLDHPDRERMQPSAVCAVEDLREVGAVFQGSDHREFHVLTYTPQQVGAGSAACCHRR